MLVRRVAHLQRASVNLLAARAVHDISCAYLRGERGSRMTAVTGPAAADAERAETYLRLKVEAELRQALSYPRYTEQRVRRVPPRFRHGAIRFRRSGRIGRAAAVESADSCVERVAVVARALSGAGAIGAGTASAVLKDMQTALAARNLIGWHQLRFHRSLGRGTIHAAHSRPAGVIRAVPVATTVVCEVEGQQARVCLGTLILETHGAWLTVTARFPPALQEPSPGSRPTALTILNDCTAADDRGAHYSVSFGGGGSPGRWDGTLAFSPIPPAAARWLDVKVAGADPVRVSLTAAPPALPTTSVPLPADGRADRYVDALTTDLLLTNPSYPESESVTAVCSLLAAGALAPSSPALSRFVAAGQRLGLQLPVSLTAIKPGSLPAEWRAMLARGDSRDGPVGVTPLAVPLPELQGVHCVVGDLCSESESATMHVHARGQYEPPDVGGYGMPVPFRWTARDDVGGLYLAAEDGGSYSDDRADLALRLRPAINPRARSMQIILTGATGEVSVTVPLDWREDP